MSVMSLFEGLLLERGDWSRIGDSYEVTKKPSDLDVGSLDAIPFAPMDSIPQGGAYHPEYTLRAPAEIRSGTYFERGDILVAKITPSFENGKQALATNLPTPFGYATTEVIPLRPRASEHDPRLLFYFLLHPDVRKHVSERMEGATGRQRIPLDVLLDVRYPCFPTEKQTARANVLEKVQQMITVETRSISAVNNLKRAAMSVLFTHGLRGEPQKETEIGPIPKSWDLVRLGDVRDRIQYGTSARCTYEVSDQPVLRIPNIGSQRINSDELKYSSLSDSEAVKYRVDCGDLILIRTNGVIDRLGSCAVYSGEPPNALFASYLIRVTLQRSRADPNFVASFLGSITGRRIVSSRATPASDGKFNLNIATLDSLSVPLPPSIMEQIEIVEILDAMARKEEIHHRRCALLNDLFNALLDDLMTGASAIDGLPRLHRSMGACYGRL